MFIVIKSKEKKQYVNFAHGGFTMEYRIKKIQEALESVSDNYFKDQSIVAFTKLAQSDTNLVVMSKEEISDLGNIPVIEKMLEMKK